MKNLDCLIWVLDDWSQIIEKEVHRMPDRKMHFWFPSFRRDWYWRDYGTDGMEKREVHKQARKLSKDNLKEYRKRYGAYLDDDR